MRDGLAYQRAYYELRKTDPEWRAARRAATAAWKKRNRRWVRMDAAMWRAVNSEKVKGYRRKPGSRIVENLRRRLRHLVRRGRATSVRSNELIGCSPAFLVKHIAVRMLHGMTWENYGYVWHIDHALPCASFDLKKRKQIKACFHFSNLQPLWKNDNAEKSAKTHRQGILAL